MDRSEIERAIINFEDRKSIDLYFLGFDRKSDYAKFILNNHKDIDVAIKCMKAILNLADTLEVDFDDER